MSKERKAEPVIFQPSVKITLQGLLAVFADPAKELCTVGFLKNTGHHRHKLEVKVKEIDVNGKETCPSFKLKDPLKLTVTPRQGISLRPSPTKIDRMVRPQAGEHSFEWAVNLEGADFYKKKIGASTAGFKPFFIINSGELYTALISETKLQRKDPGSKFWERYGFVAVVIGVHIPLDQTGVKAVLKNGNDPRPVFESEPNKRYEIFVDRGPVTQPTGTVTDAEAYYLDKAIGGKLKESEKIHFQSRVGNKAGPEAACFVASIRESDPS